MARPQSTTGASGSPQDFPEGNICPEAFGDVLTFLAGNFFGKNSTAGLLTGALVSGVQLAISTSNTAGAWDNAKKYIEATRRQSGAKSF